MPQTGLTQLGNALLQGSGDYANIQLRRQQEERQRAQQLADLQDQRRFAVSQQDAGLGKQKELNQWQARQSRIQELIGKGLLLQADANDDMKVAAADAADQERTVRLRGEGDASRENMKTAANQIGEQINRIYDAAAQVQQKLRAIPTAPTRPTVQQIQEMAIQLAMQAGEDPKSDAVRQKYQAPAAKALSDAALQEFFIAQEAADALKVSLQGYNTQLSSLDRRLDGFEKLGIFPTAIPPPAPAASLSDPASPMPTTDPMDGFRAEIEKRRRESAVATASPAPAAPAFAPTDYSHLNPSVKWIPEIAGNALRNFPSPAGAVDVTGRYGGAALRGLLTGDYSVPEKGLTQMGGEALGALFSPEILPGDYMSASRAGRLRLPRSLIDDLPPLQQLPPRTPASVFGQNYAPVR